MESTEDDDNIKADLLYKFYFQFNNSYNHKHNELHNREYLSNLSTEGQARDLYKKFIQNIIWLLKKDNNQFNKIDNGEHTEKRCIYLKYWFYDQILKKNINNSEIEKLNEDWVSKKNLLTSDKKISCEFYKLNLEQIKEIKKLYHFFIIYNIYKNNDIYPSAYCQYLKELSDIITKNTTRCESHSNDAYCNEYNTYIKPYIKKDILPLPEDKCEKPTSSISTQDVDEKTEKSESKYAIYFDLEKKGKNICSSYKDNDFNKFSVTCQDLSSGTVEYKDNIKKICEYIITTFCRLPERGKNSNIRDNYIKFLNFWFNRELKKIITDKNDRSSVYNHFNTLCSKENDLKELSDKIKEIDEEQYDKWHILYDLYDNYNNIINKYTKKSKDLKNKCTQYSKKIVELFSEVIELNNKKNDDEFNNALKEFSILYNKSKHEIHKYKKIELLELQKLTFAMDSEAAVDNKVASLCKSLKDSDTTRSALISNNANNNKDAKICAKIVSNLKKLSTIKNVGDTHADRCSNLTYWTYDIIMNELNSNTKKFIESNISRQLTDIIFRLNKELKKNENCIYYIEGNFSQWREEKDLHDYFENNKTFIQKISDNAKNAKYCEYIDYISNLYKKYMNKCCTCYSRPEYVCEEHCPKFFKCNREFFPIHLLHKLECKDDVSLQKEKENYESLIIDLDFTPNSLMLNEKKSKKKQNNYHNNGSNRKELLEHEKKTINANANKKRLRIAYHSA
ncbi:PIR protein [Plasmodium vivax]|uniref:VIR protein n=1 Tax=Plasmodium vivax TaxID=5855 RepID=A0A564ZVK5_PLAVI|nr:PIR protein [Plasmodium vivax]